jgi:hypothetical protein
MTGRLCSKAAAPMLAACVFKFLKKIYFQKILGDGFDGPIGPFIRIILHKLDPRWGSLKFLILHFAASCVFCSCFGGTFGASLSVSGNQ